MTKVSFVGAGPGDVELITLKGYKRLSNADVVIFTGSLVNHEILNYCKDSCKIYDSANMNLDQIIDTISEAVKDDKTVVRLQTGDFSIYGSIREQIERLNELNISYELIPGVSSFLAAASSLKVEYTVPEISQSLIITRLEGRTPVPKDEDLEKFAKHKTSMAIFLSASMIDKVCSKLIKGGYEEKTPVAVIYKASWPDEKIVYGNLQDIAKKVKEENITKTALILVGEFLGKSYNNSKLYDRGFSHGYRNSHN